ncbi:MAG: tRNA (adenosine(37)-N6)-dimethylallyltransferase MiaA [Lachnospiraceae bacterium]|nr:tRNA (adenosine(37)-N6)-dimethylallyltransferase MiaA [Lachnospiraceae bacterium]
MSDKYNDKPLIIIGGPTAVGKTDLSIDLARKINGSIISADSMQIYKYMDIGSAKIMPEEMRGVPHYLIDELEPNEEFGVNIFQQMAYKALDDIYSKGRIPIITGGTGFYIQALLYEIDFTEETPHDDIYRKELEQIAETEEGKLRLFDELCKTDPEYTKGLHANNSRRVIRALEYYRYTGRKFSEYNEEQREKISPFNYLYIALTDDREKIYSRIDKRVDIMMDKGLLGEVTKLHQMGYNRSYNSMQGIGYKELLDHLDGLITLDEAVERIKLDTRHFAKRQLTWLRREKDVVFLNKSDYNSEDVLLNKILEIAEDKNIWTDCISS